MTVVASARGVAKRYGDITALGGISVDVRAGETVALVGHNGAGKTTLIKLLLGLIEPSEGEVRIAGENPAGRHGAAVRRRIGFLPESVAFPGAMTGREIIAFFCRLKGESPAASLPLLERVGLGEAAKRRIATYSKGMRQRLGVAQAMIGRPELLLLDEPTSGLDPALRRDFFRMLQELRAQGCAVVLSSHALAEIEDKAERFALLGHGRMLACESFPALLAAAAMPVRVAVRVETCTTGRVVEAVAATAQVEGRRTDRLVLRCPADAKLELLRRVGGLGGIVRDIEIERPGLEAIYHTMLARQEEEERVA